MTCQLPLGLGVRVGPNPASFLSCEPHNAFPWLHILSILFTEAWRLAHFSEVEWALGWTCLLKKRLRKPWTLIQLTPFLVWDKTLFTIFWHSITPGFVFCLCFGQYIFSGILILSIALHLSPLTWDQLFILQHPALAISVVTSLPCLHWSVMPFWLCMDFNVAASVLGDGNLSRARVNTYFGTSCWAYNMY